MAPAVVGELAHPPGGRARLAEPTPGSDAARTTDAAGLRDAGPADDRTGRTPPSDERGRARVAGPTGEAYSVNTSHFTVNVATSGPCWVQITNSQSSIPLVSSVQPAGKSLSETAKGTMTVELGSSSVLVGISIKGKTVFLATPHVVPFTYTFVPHS